MLPDAAMKPVIAAMPCCTGGQAKHSAKPRSAAAPAMQVKDHRVPEKMPEKMPLLVRSQVRLKTHAVTSPSRMLPNTPVSMVWMPSTVVWPELVRPVRLSGCASRPSSFRATLLAVSAIR